jgi:hypothetical protein
MKTILIILFLVISIKIDYATKLESEARITELEDNVELSVEDSIRLVLTNTDLSPFTVELIIAQSKHESGNYQNNLTKLHNNIFARHYSKIDTLSLGSGGEAEGHTRFARYKSIKDATLSQYAYFKRKNYLLNYNSVEEFAIELKSKRYYEDDLSNYKNALIKHLNN